MVVLLGVSSLRNRYQRDRPNSHSIVRAVVAANNHSIHRREGQPHGAVSPPLVPWSGPLSDAAPAMAEEWRSFSAAGGRLPHTADLFGGWQGERGRWNSGLLVLRGHGRTALSPRFPETTTALLQVPGLLSAMWSVLGPGAELPEHRGDNAGGLRLLIGVVCPDGSSLELDGRRTPLGPGDVVLFDDTQLHGTANAGPGDRVVVLADVLRPLTGCTRFVNSAVQTLRHNLTTPYRRAAARAAEWDAALNPPR